MKKLPYRVADKNLYLQNFAAETNEQNQPLPFANVVLLSLPDSAYVTGTVSREDGTFYLNNPKGAELLRVSSIGYATIYRWRCGHLAIAP